MNKRIKLDNSHASACDPASRDAAFSLLDLERDITARMENGARQTEDSCSVRMTHSVSTPVMTVDNNDCRSTPHLSVSSGAIQPSVSWCPDTSFVSDRPHTTPRSSRSGYTEHVIGLAHHSIAQPSASSGKTEPTRAHKTTSQPSAYSGVSEADPYSYSSTWNILYVPDEAELARMRHEYPEPSSTSSLSYRSHPQSSSEVAEPARPCQSTLQSAASCGFVVRVRSAASSVICIRWGCRAYASVSDHISVSGIMWTNRAGACASICIY